MPDKARGGGLPPPPPGRAGPMTQHILIVDDEPNIVASLQFLLEDAGYAVRVAADGAQALAAVAQSHPDLILLDVMMPVLDGNEVCQRLKSEPSTQGIRILMLSARCREMEIAKSRELGADGYLTKPFSTHTLLERVRELIGPQAASP